MRKSIKKLKLPLRNSKSKFLAAALLLLMGFSFYGCLHREPAGIVTGPWFEQENKEILNLVRNKWNGIKTLKGYFRVKASVKGTRGTVRALLSISLPDRLRMELLSPAGTSEAVLAFDGNVIALYYPKEKQYFFGAANHENIAKILGVNMAPSEFLHILMGTGIDLSKKPIKTTREGDELKAYYHSRKNEYRIELILNVEQHYISEVELISRDSGELFSSVKYSGFIHGKGFSYPSAVEIDFPDKRTSYKVKITNGAYLTGELKRALFQVTPRKGTELYRLEDIRVDGTLLFGKEKR